MQRSYPFGGGPIHAAHRVCHPLTSRRYLAHRASIHHIIKLWLCTLTKNTISHRRGFVNYFLRKFS